jgi:two-component system, cell cycle response regulator
MPAMMTVSREPDACHDPLLASLPAAGFGRLSSLLERCAGNDVMFGLPAILEAGILIVDGREAHIRLLRRMLGNAGHTRITSTMNPREACELHRRNRYDAILLDLMMPGMDGFAVLEAIKAIEGNRYLPVLVTTAHPGHKLRALKAGVRGFISTPFDMTEVLMRVSNVLEVRLMHEMALALASLALRDPLTGLANRRLLDERMEIAMAHTRRQRTAMAVVYLDLDGFKKINDTLGHGAGDTLLKMVAGRLSGMMREVDTVARQGGDEFLIVLPDCAADAVASVVAKMVEAVAHPYVIDGRDVGITASAGVSLYTGHGENVGMLLKCADEALHEAKCAGKNTCRISPYTNPPLLARKRQSYPSGEGSGQGGWGLAADAARVHGSALK